MTAKFSRHRIVRAACASRDARHMTDWLVAGKYSLCIRCNAGSEVGKAMQQKLPIGYLDTEDWKEGGRPSAAGGTLGLPTRAPHPNAAKVFINWFLSREGQTALQKFGRPGAHNSRRIDISKTAVDAFNRLEDGKNNSILPSRNTKTCRPFLNSSKKSCRKNKSERNPVCIHA